MKSVRGVCLLQTLVLFATLSGEAQLSRVSAKEGSDPAEKGQIGISASYEMHGDTTIVTINWWGYSEEDIVVVDLDSKSARDYRQLDVDPGSTELFGLVLVRSAGGAGSAMFSYKNSDFVKSVGGGGQVLSVYLTSGIDLGYVSGAPTIKGGGLITEVVELTSADCMDDLQTLCWGGDPGAAEIVISTVSEFPPQAMVESRCKAFVPDSTVKGSLLLSVAR